MVQVEIFFNMAEIVELPDNYNMDTLQEAVDKIAESYGFEARHFCLDYEEVWSGKIPLLFFIKKVLTKVLFYDIIYIGEWRYRLVITN